MIQKVHELNFEIQILTSTMTPSIIKYRISIPLISRKFGFKARDTKMNKIEYNKQQNEISLKIQMLL